METLRRELQYEELINFEKHKCENAFYGNDLMRNNLILEPVQEEDDITSEDITSEEKIIEKSNLNKQDCFELSEINILNKYKDENSKNNKVKQMLNYYNLFLKTKKNFILKLK